MPKQIKRCRRRHIQNAKNTATQTNRHTRKDGSTTVSIVKVCIPCRRYRERQRSMGSPVKDLRKGRRR